MPIDEKGIVVCVSHKDTPMLRQPGFFFLTEAEKGREGSVRILANTGIPLNTYVCSICGYTENYAAMATRDWQAKRLYVTCKNEKCKREFISPIQLGEDSFEKSELRQNSYTCYHCKTTNIYDKEDHFYK